MERLKLRGIYEANFCYSDRTLFDNLRKDRKAYQGDLRGGDTYVFLSRTGDQILFILGDRKVKRGKTWVRLLDSRRWRIQDPPFTGLMLENYANEVGITLGLKRLEQWFEERDK